MVPVTRDRANGGRRFAEPIRELWLQRAAHGVGGDSAVGDARSWRRAGDAATVGARDGGVAGRGARDGKLQSRLCTVASE
jgi:hypothetical protein